MKLLALLTRDGRRALERAVGSAHTVSCENEVRAVGLSWRQHRFDVLVLDPGVLDEGGFEALLLQLKRHGIPVLLYATLSRSVARRIVRAGNGAAHELVLHGAEDEQLLLLRKLEGISRLSVPAMLFNLAAPRLGGLPDSLQASCVGLFSGGPLPRLVDDVARTAGLGRRTVDRWMRRAGIRGAAMLLDTVRLARVWEPLVELRLSPADVALRCGYGKSRLLTAHARRIVGMTPSGFGGKYTRDRFAERLANVLLRS